MTAKALPRDPSQLTIYPAGPMSGIKNENRESFEYVTKLLRARGFKVIPPVEIENPGFNYGGDAYEDFLRADIELALSKCNTLLLLPGWTRSRGANHEFNYACATGKFIFFWDAPRMAMIRMDEWSPIIPPAFSRVFNG